MSLTIKVKRAYEPAASEDGVRILVDRLWPRGVSREKLDIAFWAKGVAPSNELRKWYGHDPPKWQEFRDRYFRELDANQEGIQELTGYLGKGIVTLLYSSKEPEINNAVALRDYLMHLRKSTSRKEKASG